MNLRNNGVLAKRQTIAMIAVAAFHLKKQEKKIYESRSNFDKSMMPDLGMCFFLSLHDRTINMVLQLQNLSKGYL